MAFVVYERSRRGPIIEPLSPVTVSFIGFTIGVRVGLFKDLLSLEEAWFLHGAWKCLFFAAVFHLDDLHLCYNMASFLWKGISVERQMGSLKFLYILAVFTISTNAALLSLDLALAIITGNLSYIYTCAPGFSGVIFPLKVLTTYNLPSGVSVVMGMFPVPMRWACWAELVSIQLLFPNASFTGPLAGILVGLMYVKGPLKYIMDTVSGAGEHPKIIPHHRHNLSLHNKCFQSSHGALVGTRAKKCRGRGEGETLADKPHNPGKCPFIFHGSVHL